ncbi:MAG: crossover junction endodeoxyribonuclease RuvC [Clostridia bacterium]|nr:crossover junction endodeoxyribonuclease RuvC [Clostridia bacterium]
MLILGIDPGTALTGYGVVERKTDGRLAALAWGCIRTAPGEAMPTRLATIHRELTLLLRQHKPDFLAIEELFFNKNARTALTVGQARGVALLAAAHEGVSVWEYTPLEIKQAVAGHGRAPKRQIQRMVATLLNLKAPPEPDDVADALAVAICHAQFYNFKGIVLGSRGQP